MIDIKLENELQTMPIENHQIADDLISQIACPRRVDEVYFMGMLIQGYICSLNIDSLDMSKNTNNSYSKLVLKEMNIKQQIQCLANENLNRLLTYFYDNGGPIIEAPVSEEAAKEIEPFFNRIIAIFLDQVSYMADETVKRNIGVSEFENKINDHVTSMYTALSKLFRVEEMQKAFEELIDIRKSNQVK